jgi:glycosyltransferase involved in cell wall biosynthesis
MGANYDDEMPLVTIVMRTYERPVLLARAIASVQNQTFRDWTLIIVNNGGNPGPVDDVVRVAKSATPNGDIRVLHLSERVGMEEASNRGLAATQSEYFAIHDDDDSWAARFLEVAVEEMHAHPSAAAVVTGINRIHELYRDGKVRPMRAEDFFLNEERLTYMGMIGNNTFPPIAALFQRRLLQEVGEFDSSLPVLGDWEFNLRAVLAGGFVFVPERLANYHTRTPDSETASGNSITVGIDLHHEIRGQLQKRWLNEPNIDGVNKGELSIASYVDERPLQNRGLMSMIAVGIKNPTRAARAVARRIRRIISR